jgi:hypothetical protein
MGDDDNGTIERLPTPEIQAVDPKPEGGSGKGKGKGEEGIELGVLSKFENDASQQPQVGKQIALADMLNPEKKYMSGWRLYCLTFGYVLFSFLMFSWESNEDIGADYSSGQLVYESSVIDPRDNNSEYEFGVHHQCAPRIRE